MKPLARKGLEPLIHLALREDKARRDLTSSLLLPPQSRIRAQIRTNAPGIFAGGVVAAHVFRVIDPSLRCRVLRNEGALLRCGEALLTIEGRARSIFAAERTALNLLGHLCGIATLTHSFVQRTKSSRATILDTRKTLPGLRALEKYAVRAGGGHSHRASLRDAVLIKTNHLEVLRQGTGDRGQVIRKAVAAAKRQHPTIFVEVEVTNLSEFQAALAMRPHAVLLDNMSLRDIRHAVLLRRNLSPVSRPLPPLLEVSGGVTLANVRAIAKTGVDRIAIGRLTHSAPSLDLSLEVIT